MEGCTGYRGQVAQAIGDRLHRLYDGCTGYMGKLHRLYGGFSDNIAKPGQLSWGWA